MFLVLAPSASVSFALTTTNNDTILQCRTIQEERNPMAVKSYVCHGRLPGGVFEWAERLYLNGDHPREVLCHHQRDAVEQATVSQTRR